MKPTLLFLTTNFVWGGSEILWTNAAKELLFRGHSVKAVAGYDPHLIKPYGINNADFFQITKVEATLSLQQRLLRKLGLKEYSLQNSLLEFVKTCKPSLAIISQGNNTEGAPFMELLSKLNIPFVTITHLVVDSTWPAQNDNKINLLQNLFNKAAINFFVSKYVWSHHEKFLGYTCSNAALLYNPFLKKIDNSVEYPNLINGNYCIALIGRLECYHKGYDLLIEVLSSEKWRSRNIKFSIYGTGPHRQLIERLINLNNITNITLKGHEDNVAEIWKTHHLLLMPSRLEGQSLTLIEAMRFKRGVIVTQVGGVEELVDEGITGFIAAYPHANTIDEAMERAWNKRADWKQIGLNALDKILAAHPADTTDYFIKEIGHLLG